MDDVNGEFGSSRSHNRHFLILSAVVLAGCVAVLYILGQLGYFGIGQISEPLTEEKCYELLSQDVPLDVAFSESIQNGKTVKQANFFNGSYFASLMIEIDGSNIKCSVRQRAKESLFKAKGLGSSEYKCDSIIITYTGLSENQYYLVVKETILPETATVELTGRRPGEETGIPDVDSQIQNLPENLEGDVEFDFGEFRYIQEKIYLSSNGLYNSQLDSLRSNYCPSFFELIS